MRSHELCSISNWYHLSGVATDYPDACWRCSSIFFSLVPLLPFTTFDGIFFNFATGKVMARTPENTSCVLTFTAEDMNDWHNKRNGITVQNLQKKGTVPEKKQSIC